MALAGSTGAHGYRRGCRVVRSSVVLVGRSGDGLDGGPIASFDAGNPRTRGCGPWALLRADPLVVSGFRGIGILCASAECAGSRNRDGSVGSAGADVRGYQTRRYRRRHFHGASPSYLGSHRGTLVCNGVGIVHVTMLVLVCSLRTSKRACWILYGVLAAVSVALFLYSAVLLLVHAVIVVFGAKVIPDADSKRNRFNGLCFVGASASAVLLVSPLIALSLGQSRQVSWIPPLDRHIFTTIAVDQWFLSSPLFAVVAGIIVLSGIAGYFFAPSRWTVGDRSASTVALVWILVPMALFSCIRSSWETSTSIGTSYSLRRVWPCCWVS